MTLATGDTFIGEPSGPGTSGGEHLWIVLHTYVDAGTPLAIIVNVTSLRTPTGDRSCILQQGDHPFVRHDSYIYYRGALEIELSLLGSFPRRSPVSQQLLTRVRAGFHASRFTRRGLKGKVPQ